MNYKKSFVLFIALLAASPLFAQETVRVMSYNVRNCVGMDGSRFDVDRVAKVVTGANPDIAGIQELDCKTERSGGRDILTELSAGTKHWTLCPADSGPKMSDVICRTMQLWLRRIPAGIFKMGSPNCEIGRHDNERQRLVTITNDFLIFFKNFSNIYFLYRKYSIGKSLYSFF